MNKGKIAHMTNGMHIHKTEEYDKTFEQLSRAEKRAIKRKKKSLKVTEIKEVK